MHFTGLKSYIFPIKTTITDSIVLKQGENNKFKAATFILLKKEKKKKSGRYFQDVALFKAQSRIWPL